MKIVAFCVFLLVAGLAHAGTATLTWAPYAESPTFKELRVFRGSGSACGSSTPLKPLLTGTPAVQVVIPKGTPTPSTYIDTAAPDTVGMLCYELTGVNLVTPPGGGTPVMLESGRSNRAIKFVVSSVPAPTSLKVAP